MDSSDLKQVFELAERREDKKYEWLRWLILLASGAFAILVAFHEHVGPDRLSRLLMNIAWVGLGSGIIFGAFAIYGEVHTAKTLIKNLVSEMHKDRDHRRPVTAPIPAVLRFAEYFCYIALLTAVLAIMSYACLKT